MVEPRPSVTASNSVLTCASLYFVALLCLLTRCHSPVRRLAMVIFLMFAFARSTRSHCNGMALVPICHVFINIYPTCVQLQTIAIDKFQHF